MIAVPWITKMPTWHKCNLRSPRHTFTPTTPVPFTKANLGTDLAVSTSVGETRITHAGHAGRESSTFLKSRSSNQYYWLLAGSRLRVVPFTELDTGKTHSKTLPVPVNFPEVSQAACRKRPSATRSEGLSEYISYYISYFTPVL